MKINARLLPVKAHYFFFMAAMGPILPQLSVYGKQLGISTIIMGTVNGVLPIMFLLAKPLFGFIVDKFREYRKFIFITIVVAMGLFYALLYIVPFVDDRVHISAENISCRDISLCEPEYKSDDMCEHLLCEWQCDGWTNVTSRGYPLRNDSQGFCLFDNDACPAAACNVSCVTDSETEPECAFRSVRFWMFVVFMSAGTIGFNVINSISDAICFDVLGEGEQMSYGKQRVWGTIGFGISALLSGIMVDWWSKGDIKSFTPALTVMLLFLFVDMFCCTKLKLPVMETPKNIIKDVLKLMRHQHIRIFMIFAGLAGVIDGFIVYFLFWYLEDLAVTTDTLHHIKLLEGIIVACETLGGEVIFFSLSGVILSRIGYGHSLSMCFVFYALRLGLISIAPTPWWVIPIELFLQGPTYAMCYTTIVAYASAISPPGTSATMQGVVAGIDDGLGYAIGSVLSGVLFRLVGGKATLQILSALALSCGILHFILYKTSLQNKIPKTSDPSVNYQTPEDAICSTVSNMQD